MNSWIWMFSARPAREWLREPEQGATKSSYAAHQSLLVSSVLAKEVSLGGPLRLNQN